MSDLSNEQLMERAVAMMDYWEGCATAKVIEHLIELNDMEKLREVVFLAEADAARDELYSNGDLGDWFEMNAEDTF